MLLVALFVCNADQTILHPRGCSNHYQYHCKFMMIYQWTLLCVFSFQFQKFHLGNCGSVVKYAHFCALPTSICLLNWLLVSYMNTSVYIDFPVLHVRSRWLFCSGFWQEHFLLHNTELRMTLQQNDPITSCLQPSHNESSNKWSFTTFFRESSNKVVFMQVYVGIRSFIEWIWCFMVWMINYSN